MSLDLSWRSLACRACWPKTLMKARMLSISVLIWYCKWPRLKFLKLFREIQKAKWTIFEFHLYTRRPLHLKLQHLARAFRLEHHQVLLLLLLFLSKPLQQSLLITQFLISFDPSVTISYAQSLITQLLISFNPSVTISYEYSLRNQFLISFNTSVFLRAESD